MKRTLAALATSVLIAPVAHAQSNDVDWTGGRPLPPSTQVPFEPGYATQWRSYDVVRFGDRNFQNPDVQGVRVLGQFDQKSVMCLMNAKGGQWGCYVDGKEATEIQHAPYGKIITTDPVVKFFAPVISFFVRLTMNFEAFRHGGGSSVY